MFRNSDHEVYIWNSVVKTHTDYQYVLDEKANKTFIIRHIQITFVFTYVIDQGRCQLLMQIMRLLRLTMCLTEYTYMCTLNEILHLEILYIRVTTIDRLNPSERSSPFCVISNLHMVKLLSVCKVSPFFIIFD